MKRGVPHPALLRPELGELLTPALILAVPFVVGGLGLAVGERLHRPTGGLSSSLWFVEPVLWAAGLGVLCPLVAFTMTVRRGPAWARVLLIVLEVLALAAAVFALDWIFGDG